jgi:HAD superfamily hydrolase (TIGR01484 family)
MRISNFKKLKNKDLIVFDLDGTVAPSKSAMDSEMAELLKKLLDKKSVAVISGGEIKQFRLQLLGGLKGHRVDYSKLFLFPTCSSVFYKYFKGKWKVVYAYYLKPAQVKKIKDAFKQAYKEIGYKDPEKTYGVVIENRKTQVSFSALGQKVVQVFGKRGIEMKEAWRKNNDIRPKMAKVLQNLLPQFEVKIGGITTIDVTKKGIDKAYGILQMQKHLRVPISKMLFIGDAMFKGGNDYAVVKTGVDWISVRNPKETKKIISQILKKYD